MASAPDSVAAVPEVSVVLPVYRNQASLESLHARLVAALARVPASFELLFVDDCSPDGSLDVLRRLALLDPRVRVIALDVRGGQLAALRRGLADARGQTIVTMDADLQDPPEAIPLLLATLAEGYAAVYAGRRGRYEPSGRLVSSWIFKHAVAAVSGMPSDAGSFVAMRREVADRILALPDRAPYLTAAVAWAGRHVTSVPVLRERRPDGRSSYTAGMRFGMGAVALAQALRWRIRRVGR
jgi:polyisoprenyl-phosphate glycosyltransferase